MTGETIYLTGFMGAGKTTIGKKLGEELSMTVVDTDKMIEEICQKKISDIFKEDGEVRFREYESRILKSLSLKHAIVTTGGGIINSQENRRFMKENGIVIYLHCDPKVILRRLRDDTTRPLLEKNKDKTVVNMLDARLPYYLEADYTVNTTMKSVDTIITEMTHFLNRYSFCWAQHK
ncbi:shikimate kinase [Scopulibacillus daqui]|uniref:Shikimate kinase n=1 Tax=Scopulibacillus daqui TaxID=1469162 RepID=A0ABS2Q226_9BACL|nr:shikimate kinase [Scopulibacillus daqui]MBM7646349.1 shikimate kinase [Scopulibacillus daqui]